MRLQAAKSLSNPNFRPKIAQTNAKKKDTKRSRRSWKHKGQY